MNNVTTKKITVGMLLVFMVISIFLATGVVAAKVENVDPATSGEGVGTDAVTALDSIGVAYRGHVQNVGDMPNGEDNFISGPKEIGTRGLSLRVEGFMIKLTGDVPEGAKIVYEVHVENEGWMEPVSNGDFAGTRAKSQRVESIKIRLENLPGYDVYYRGHVQNIGDIPQVEGQWGWVKNGAALGTTGSSLRLEELQVKIVKQEVVSSDVVYDKAGTYGPAFGSKTITGNVEITKPGVILQNIVVNGNLTVGEGVGEGDVTLNNVVVKGETYIKGGGKNSIHINGGQYNKITVMQTESGQTRIVATGANNLEVVISEDATGEDIILEGNFNKVSIDAPNVVINTQGDTKINQFDIGAKATNSDLNTKTGTTINNLKIEAPVVVTGPGTIANADVKSNGVSFETAPAKQNVDPAVTKPPVVTPPVTPPVTPTPGGGGGIITPTMTPITYLGITGMHNVGDTMGALPQPATATGNYQWYRSDTETGTYTPIVGATGKTYVLQAGDANKWIKVGITGTGSYSGTKSSISMDVTDLKNLTGFSQLPDLNLDVDEHLSDLIDLIDSGKLPTQMTVTDGVDTITVPIVDWQGDYDGATLDPQPLNAIWVIPSGYTTTIEIINPVVVVRVNTPQTKIISSQKDLVATTIGEISGQTVINIPKYTEVGMLKSALKPSSHAAVEIFDGPGAVPVADQDNTEVTETMIIRVTAEDGSSKDYGIVLSESTPPRVDTVSNLRFVLNGSDVWLKLDQPTDMTGITGFDIVLSTDGMGWDHRQTVLVDANYSADNLYVSMAPVAAMISNTTHFTHAKIISRPDAGYTGHEIDIPIDFTITIDGAPLSITPARQLDGTVEIGLPSDKLADQTYLCRFFDATEANSRTEVIASSNEAFWKDGRTLVFPESSVPTDDLLISIVRITNGTTTGLTATDDAIDGTAITALPGSNERAIVATGIGNFDANGNIIAVPQGTKVAALLAHIGVSPNATADILTGSGGAPVTDQTTTDVTNAMVVQVTAENGRKTEYRITLSEDLIQVGAATNIEIVPTGGDVFVTFAEPASMAGVKGFEILFSSDGTTWSQKKTINCDQYYNVNMLAQYLSVVSGMIDSTTHYSHVKINTLADTGYTGNEIIAPIDFTITKDPNVIAFTAERTESGGVALALTEAKAADQTYVYQIFDDAQKFVRSDIITTTAAMFWQDDSTILLPNVIVPSNAMTIKLAKITGGTTSGLTATTMTANGVTITVPASSAKALISTTKGSLDNGNVINVPTGTKVSDFKSGLVASSKATIEIITGTNGAAVADQTNTDVTSDMKILVTAEDNSQSEYGITTV